MKELPFESGAAHETEAVPSPTCTRTEFGAVGAIAGRPSQFGIALHTSSRPLLATLPLKPLGVSTLARIRARRSGVASPGSAARMSTAAPETIGAAIEVPLNSQYDGSAQLKNPVGTVERIWKPGAAMSTAVAP